MTTTDELREHVARTLCGIDVTGSWKEESDFYLRQAGEIIRLVVDACARPCDDFDAPPSDSDFVNGQATAAQQIRARIRALAPKEPSP